MSRKIIYFLAICAFSALGQTRYGDMTLPPGAFLWLSPDAATEALGGAGTAVTIENAVGWANPANLFVDNRLFSAGANYSYLRDQTSHSNLFGRWKRNKWACGARLFLLDVGEIEARSGPSSEPDYTFTSHQLYLSFVGARRIEGILDLGTSAKWIYEHIDQSSRSGWVFDFGAATRYKFVRAGVAVQNWGQEVVFKLYRERYPLTYRAGLSADVFGRGTICADWIKPDLLSGWLAVGGEWKVSDFALLRLGYTPGHDTRNISGGLGISKKGLSLDYAIVNYSNGLGASHNITLSYAPGAR